VKRNILLLIILSSMILLPTFSYSQNLGFSWVKQLGGAGSDEGYSVTTDAAGNVYTTGTFSGTADFDPDDDLVFSLNSLNGNIFISKLNAAGNFIWAKQLGGTSYAESRSITLDALGNVYTTGSFQQTADFNPGALVFNLSAIGNYDIFISKLDTSGNFVWAKQFGGANTEDALSITTDTAGNVYTTGSFSAKVDFDPGIGLYRMTSNGFRDIFISKLDPSGNFIWAKQLGGAGNDQANSIVTDKAGNIYTTGYFEGILDFDPDSFLNFNLTSAGDHDIFISKLDSAGKFVFAKQMGGPVRDVANSITIDASGNIYTTGSFQQTGDFDPGVLVFNLTANGYDIFISKLDTSGNFIWAKQFGGTGLDEGQSSVVDSAGNIFTTGRFDGTTDFDPGVGVYNLTSTGLRDIFIFELDVFGNLSWAKQIGGTGIDDAFSNSIAIDVGGNIYTTGCFKGTFDFDPDLGIFSLASFAVGAFNFDVFVHKLGQSGFGINENYACMNMGVCPNPNDGKFRLNIDNLSSKVSLEIYTILGERVYLSAINEKQTIIDISSLSKGIYFVKVVNGTSERIKKMVIQ
jgi:hypothetical protein